MSFDKFQLLSSILSHQNKQFPDLKAVDEFRLRLPNTTRHVAPSKGPSNLKILPMSGFSGKDAQLLDPIPAIVPSSVRNTPRKAQARSSQPSPLPEDDRLSRTFRGTTTISVLKQRADLSTGNLSGPSTCTPRDSSVNSSASRFGKANSLRRSVEGSRQESPLPSSLGNSSAFKLTQAHIDSKNFGVLSRQDLNIKFHLLKDKLSPIFKQKRLNDTHEQIISRIVSSKKLLENFEDPMTKRSRIRDDFTARNRDESLAPVSADQSQRNWISPLSCYKQDNVIKIKVLRRHPNLTLKVTKPQVTPSFSPERITEEDEKPEIDENLNKKAQRGKSEPSVHHFSYDQSSFAKYLLEFVKLAGLTNEMRAANTNENSVSFEENCIQQHLKAITRSVAESSMESLFPKIADIQAFIKTQGVYTCVLKEQYKSIFENRKKITARILQALDIDYKQDFAQVDWEHYLSFMKVLVHYEATKTEISSFVLKFLQGKDKVPLAKTVKKLFKMIESEYEEESTKRSAVTEFADQLFKDWDKLGILTESSQYMSAADFKSAYINNKLNIYKLLDLITHHI